MLAQGGNLVGQHDCRPRNRHGRIGMPEEENEPRQSASGTRNNRTNVRPNLICASPQRDHTFAGTERPSKPVRREPHKGNLAVTLGAHNSDYSAHKWLDMRSL